MTRPVFPIRLLPELRPYDKMKAAKTNDKGVHYYG